MAGAITMQAFARSNPASLIADLALSKERTFMDDLNEVGSGSFTLPFGDPQIAAITDDALIRCFVDGTAAFQWVARRRHRNIVSESEEDGQTTTFSGPGALDLWAEAKLQPELGTTRKPQWDTRLFNWTSQLFNDSVWGIAQIISDSPYKPNPVGITSDTKWIWGTAEFGTPPQQLGNCYFRRNFTIPTTGPFRLFATADDELDVYLDGGQVLSATQDAGSGSHLWQNIQRVDLNISQGPHVLAIRGRNVERPMSPLTNRAAVILRLHEIDPSGALTVGGFELNTDSTWKTNAYPPGPPGMSVGEVIRHLLTEAQLRGEMPGVTLGFNDAFDSRGAAWSIASDIAFPVGQDLLACLRQLGQTYIDFNMRPSGLVLDAWLRRGAAQAVTLTTGYSGDVNASILEHGDDHDTSTRHDRAVVRWADGYVQRDSGSAVNGWRPVFLQLGDVKSEEEAIRIADAYLARTTGALSYTTRIEAVAGKIPFVNFGVGDTIAVPTFAGGTSIERIIALAANEDADGVVQFTPEFGTRATDFEVLIDRQLTRMGLGSAGSLAVESASPARKFMIRAHPVPAVGFPLIFTLAPGAPAGVTPFTSAPHQVHAGVRYVELVFAATVPGSGAGATSTVNLRRNGVILNTLQLNSGETTKIQASNIICNPNDALSADGTKGNNAQGLELSCREVATIP